MGDSDRQDGYYQGYNNGYMDWSNDEFRTGYEEGKRQRDYEDQQRAASATSSLDSSYNPSYSPPSQPSTYRGGEIGAALAGLAMAFGASSFGGGFGILLLFAESAAAGLFMMNSLWKIYPHWVAIAAGAGVLGVYLFLNRLRVFQVLLQIIAPVLITGWFFEQLTRVHVQFHWINHHLTWKLSKASTARLNAIHWEKTGPILGAILLAAFLLHWCAYRDINKAKKAARRERVEENPVLTKADEPASKKKPKIKDEGPVLINPQNTNPPEPKG